jgi:branched-chain amino acid transport system substrate-binding protein
VVRTVLARGRALAGCACAALAVALTGCTAPSGSSVTVSGKTLTIYVSAPVGGAGGSTARDVLDAEKLAFDQAGGQIGGFQLKYFELTGGKLSDHARTAIQDTTAIAYLGEVVPGTSGDTVGITNAQDLLQVSPTDTAAELTQSVPQVPSSPDYYYESLKTNGATFARVTPTTKSEAKALVQEMQSLGITKLYVTDDGSPYGSVVAGEVSTAAAGAGLKSTQGAPQPSSVSAAAADGVFMGTADPAAATRLFDAVVAGSPRIKLFAPSALDYDEFAQGLNPAAQRNLTISSPGFSASDLPATAQSQFVALFEAKYEHAPAPQAIFGYEAMSAVLAVLREAGAQANNRSTVVRDFYAIKNRSSVLGTYTITGGDTNLTPFVFLGVSAGHLKSR